MHKLNKALLIIVSLLFSTIVYYSCIHHVKEIPNPSGTLPTNLTYNPSSVQLSSGESFTSVAPKFAGGQPSSYSLTVNPDDGGSITIDPHGVIHVDSFLVAGSYIVSVIAANESGNITFKNVYQITITNTPKAPSAINYFTDTIRISHGTENTTQPPAVNGTFPITFKISTTPDAGGHITINDSTGAISVDSLIAPGNYNIAVTATNSIGTQNFKDAVVISVKATINSALSYVPNNLELVYNTASKSSIPTISGTIPISYAITSNPSSPLITINSTTGQITADKGLAIGTYIIAVTSTNAGGSFSFGNVYEIKVSGSALAPTNFSYATSDLVVTSGQTESSVAPNISGTTPITYSLPSGTNQNISINAQTGVVSAGSALPVGTYNLVVTATNTAGSATTSFTITVNGVSAPSNLVYTPSSISITQGATGSSTVPTITSSQAVTYTMVSSPATTGISIDSKTGVITSTGTLQVGTYYIQVTASNSGGVITFINAFSITVGTTVPANLNYAPNSLSLTTGSSGTSSAPAISGTGPFTYALTSSPTNANITINSSTGIISVASGSGVGSYDVTVTVTNSSGSKAFSNVYTVNVTSTATAPSSLNYSPATLTLDQGQIGTSVGPSVTGTTPITYSIVTTPTSSGNITVNPQTGIITASPSLASGTYKASVTAINSVGSTTATYTITVNTIAAPSNLVYTPATLTLGQGTAGSSVSPTITGGPVTYSITSSPVSSAISINTNTGVISATSALTSGSYVISVTATNSGGSKVFSNAYTITVNAIAPSGLVYSPNAYSVNQGTAGSSVAPTVSGTPPITYSIAVTPANAGISINSTTGVIASTSSLAAGSYAVTVTATNTAGNATTNYTITVNSSTVKPSALTYSPATLTVTQGTSGGSSTPNITGTAPFTYAIVSSPANANITINSTTGVISAGSATASGTYSVTVTATNSAGSATTSYTIMVNGSSIVPLSGLTYAPSTLTVGHGAAGTSATPKVTGTGPVTYSIVSSPSSSGLTVNASSGVISSSTSVAVGTYTVTVTATSSGGGGSTTAVYTLTVAPTYALDIKPIMSGSCTSCHNGGTSPNLTTISGVQNNITNIITDVQLTRNSGSNHIMPPNGAKLTTAQINLLKQWQSSGMLP